MQGVSLTIQEKEKFLQKLKSFNGNVSQAARSIKIGRSAIYEHKKDDADFSKAWDEIIDGLVDDAEKELYRRAVKGVRKPVFYKGEEVAAIKEYSDTLLMFFLKGKKPQTYRERFDIDANVKGTLDVNIAAAIDQLYDAKEDS